MCEQTQGRERKRRRKGTHWAEDRATCEMVSFVYFFFDHIYEASTLGVQGTLIGTRKDETDTTTVLREFTSYGGN